MMPRIFPVSARSDNFQTLENPDLFFPDLGKSGTAALQ
jgi:hypothetical protein